MQISEFYFLPIAALADVDYVNEIIALTFYNGSVNSSRECVYISIIDDGVLESNQTFTLQLMAPHSSITLATDTITVVIVDNDSTRSALNGNYSVHGTICRCVCVHPTSKDILRVKQCHRDAMPFISNCRGH